MNYEFRECLFTAARSVDIDLIEPIRETVIEAKKKNTEERTISWEEKMLHGQFVRQNKEVGNQNRCQYCEMVPKESLVFAAQEQSIRTNVTKGKIDKSQEQPQCRMCTRANEIMIHIVSECPKLVQREYKRRHD